MNPIAYRSLGLNFSENLAKPLFFLQSLENIWDSDSSLERSKIQFTMVGLRQTDIKGQFVSFQVSNWVGSCMAWPAMTMTVY